MSTERTHPIDGHAVSAAVRPNAISFGEFVRADRLPRPPFDVSDGDTVVDADGRTLFWVDRSRTDWLWTHVPRVLERLVELANRGYAAEQAETDPDAVAAERRAQEARDLEEAKKRLRERDGIGRLLLIEVVASRMGYGKRGAMNFSRWFRERTGQSPTEWREANGIKD